MPPAGRTIATKCLARVGPTLNRRRLFSHGGCSLRRDLLKLFNLANCRAEITEPVKRVLPHFGKATGGEPKDGVTERPPFAKARCMRVATGRAPAGRPGEPAPISTGASKFRSACRYFRSWSAGAIRGSSISGALPRESSRTRPVQSCAHTVRTELGRKLSLQRSKTSVILGKPLGGSLWTETLWRWQRYY